jgi:hypothetical protein
MRTVTIQLESISSYSQSKKIDRDFPRNKDEPWNDYEARVWKEKAHYAEDGRVFIPQFAFKQAIDGASKYLGKIGGKGNATWTKHFVGGVVVSESIVLPDTRDTITSVWISANANGKRGSGTRVDRCFPVIPKWSGSLKCVILADEITKDAFAQALEFAGSLTGIGRFRPENGGNNGRFVVKKITWN